MHERNTTTHSNERKKVEVSMNTTKTPETATPMPALDRDALIELLPVIAAAHAAICASSKANDESELASDAYFAATCGTEADHSARQAFYASGEALLVADREADRAAWALLAALKEVVISEAETARNSAMRSFDIFKKDMQRADELNKLLNERKVA